MQHVPWNFVGLDPPPPRQLDSGNIQSQGFASHLVEYLVLTFEFLFRPVEWQDEVVLSPLLNPATIQKKIGLFMEALKDMICLKTIKVAVPNICVDFVMLVRLSGA